MSVIPLHILSESLTKVLMTLNSQGDVVVMEGAEVQECYEYKSFAHLHGFFLTARHRHTVIPFNFRIAATARWIGGDNASTFR